MAEQRIQSISITFTGDQQVTIDSDGDAEFSTGSYFTPNDIDIVKELSQLIQRENAN